MKKTKLLIGKSKFLDGKVKVLGKSKELEMYKTKHLTLGKSKELEMYKTKHLTLGKSKELASLKKLKN